MCWKNSVLVMAIVLVFFGCKSDKQDRMLALSEGPLIESQELMAQLGKPGLKIIDVRSEQDFAKGHISGALRIGRGDMERLTDTIPGIRAEASQMARLLSEKGVIPNDWLVLYDDRGNPEAARLWCILSGYGKNRIKLLNGGLEAWETAGYELHTAIQETVPAAFDWEVKAPKPVWINAEDIVQAIGRPGSQMVLIDTRTPDEYHGTRQKTNAVRAGHIPGAIHLDWADLIEYHGDHRFKQKDKIQSKLAKLGIAVEDTIVLYCHSGVRSSLSTFVLREVMGYPNVWNYDGSWTEWSRIKNYPIESDSVTTIFN